MAVDRDPAFRTVRVREGYDLDDVDDFIDRVLDTLEGRARRGRSLTPEQIESYEFNVVRFREGYAMDDVDDWLDAAAAELRQRSADLPESVQPVEVAEHQVAEHQVPEHQVPEHQVPEPRHVAGQHVANGWREAATVGATAAPAVAAGPALTPTAPPPLAAPTVYGSPPTSVPTSPALGDVLAPFGFDRRSNPEETLAAPSLGRGWEEPPAAVSPPNRQRPAGRPVASIPAPTTGLHHLEVWVGDLSTAERSFGWLFERLGWTLFQVWEHGRSWQAPGQGPYVVMEQSPDLRSWRHDRQAPGLNHLALAVPERWMVDRVVAEAPLYGWRLLFTDRHPYAGGADHYAAYLENDEGFEVEVVAA